MRRIAIDRARRFRWLLGVVLLLAGMGSLWAAPQRDSPEVLVGWLLIIAATLLFTYRNYVEVNPDRRRIAHRMGFVFTWPRASFEIARIERVEIKSFEKDAGGDDGDTRTVYAISVKGEAGGQLCEHTDMFAARLVAERVARALNMPLENRLFGGRSVRKPEDLDVPLAERWRQSGRLKTAPVIDGTSTLVARHDGDVSELTLPVAAFPRATAALTGTSLVAGITFITVYFELPWAIPAGFILVILYFTLAMILRHSGRDRLRFRAGRVEYRRGWLPTRQQMSISGIEEVLSNDGTLVLMDDREHIVIDRPPAKHDRELLRQFIDRQIAQRQDNRDPH